MKLQIQASPIVIEIMRLSEKIITTQKIGRIKKKKKRPLHFNGSDHSIYTNKSLSSSHNPTALTTKAAAATTTAANAGGTNKSIFDRLNSSAGKHSTSPGPSNGILTAPSPSPHAREKPEDGVMAHTNAISGANDATATVTVSSAVHDAA